jgi:battenin
LFNNSSYVIMIAGAKSISPSMVGLVYVCLIVPSFTMKISGPYWYHLIEYKTRIFIATMLMTTSFVLVAIGGIKELQWLQFLGIICGSFQSGMGESSFLAFTAFFDSRVALTAWSSGTGVAGLFGFGWVVFFTLGMDLSFPTTLFCGLIIPVGYWLNFVCLFNPPVIDREASDYQPLLDDESDRQISSDGSEPPVYHPYSYNPPELPALSRGSESSVRGRASSGPRSLMAPRGLNLRSDDDKMENNTGEDVDLSAAASNMTSKERIAYTLALWPYMIPLFVVYFSEYAMQAGVWAAIGFPVDKENSRNEFYTLAGFSYQAGVFVSRSSGTLWKADMAALWIMPACQVVLLVFFILDAYLQWWYNWSLLCLCFVVGLFGGGVYVGGFSLLAESVKPELKEFSLTASGVAVDIGVAFANVSAIFLQKSLYDYYNISDSDD